MSIKLHKKWISFLLILVMSFVMIGCNFTPEVPPTGPPAWTNPSLSDPNGSTETEDIITEDIINEFITTEIYLKELIVAEDKITQLLEGEDIINEVMLCKSIYVPQEHIEDFAENSQTEQLFGSGIDFGALATKLAVGTGIIVTLVILTKVGLPEPLASVVVGAASGAMKFAATGAAIGSLYGGLTGAADQIDETKRTSAVIGVATAVVGLVISVVSLISSIPSGGASSIGVVEGIKIALAGVSVLTAAAGTVMAGINAVKTFKTTEAKDIDWNNIDWEKVGVSAVEQAINSAADGYMWGSITGAVYGGVNGYAHYHKHGTPYSTYKQRIAQTPKDGNGGRWSGKRGESDFILDQPLDCDGVQIPKITYKNCVPDFSGYQIAKVDIASMTNSRSLNFKQADELLSKLWTKIKHQGKTWTARDIELYRTQHRLTWHEMNNMETMQLVPTDLNARFGHLGGVGEYNAMIAGKGGGDFD